MAETGRFSQGSTASARPVTVTFTWDRSDGTSDTAADAEVTVEPDAARTASARACPAATPPPTVRAARSPSEAASWTTWAAWAQSANWTTARSSSIMTGITSTASTTTEPSSS